MKIKTHKNFNFCRMDLLVDKNLPQIINARCSLRVSEAARWHWSRCIVRCFCLAQITGYRLTSIWPALKYRRMQLNILTFQKSSHFSGVDEKTPAQRNLQGHFVPPAEFPLSFFPICNLNRKLLLLPACPFWFFLALFWFFENALKSLAGLFWGLACVEICPLDGKA